MKQLAMPNQHWHYGVRQTEEDDVALSAQGKIRYKNRFSYN